MYTANNRNAANKKPTLQINQSGCEPLNLEKRVFTWSSLLSQLVDNYGDNSADNHVLSTSQIQYSETENETVNDEEAEAQAMEFENGKLFYAFISFSDYGLEVNI